VVPYNNHIHPKEIPKRGGGITATEISRGIGGWWGGVQTTKPTMGEVWIFSGTTSFKNR